MAAEEDLLGELAREIRAAVAEFEPRRETARPAAEELGWEEDLRVPLRRAEEHLTPAIPETVRFSRGKSLVLRLLRFLWRDQASFNALLIEAGNGVVSALERQSRRFERFAEEVGRWRNAWEEFRRRDSIQDGRIAHLEALPARSPAAPAPAAGEPPLPESLYALFEERFRGSPEAITEKQRLYLPLVRGLPGPVVDAGCGRGEFLRLLKAEGIPARGVETSGLACAAARAAGLDVSQEDAIEFLAGAAGGSLGGVVAFQVVEHWPAAATFRFLTEARRALAPGGVLIVETVNTDSLAAMNAFYLDPSHVRPVPPQALAFLCEAAGFRDIRVELLAPVAVEDRLTETSENDAKLNALLFGPQDYAVIARVPSP